jgi:hypothetical protein
MVLVGILLSTLKVNVPTIISKKLTKVNYNTKYFPNFVLEEQFL